MDGKGRDDESHEPVESLADFFDRIEREGGLSLEEEDYRLIVETIRMDRDHGH